MERSREYAITPRSVGVARYNFGVISDENKGILDVSGVLEKLVRSGAYKIFTESKFDRTVVKTVANQIALSAYKDVLRERETESPSNNVIGKVGFFTMQEIVRYCREAGPEFGRAAVKGLDHLHDLVGQDSNKAMRILKLVRSRFNGDTLFEIVYAQRVAEIEAVREEPLDRLTHINKALEEGEELRATLEDLDISYEQELRELLRENPDLKASEAFDEKEVN
ncbi:MAG: hypothetical protein KGH59_02750 [Candidatus Micrarchaeota archaeon]|nr:hypothetical protein [Candidatus Micrarchaeota archaeon]MDE1804675.1 hypothetical protein [Candidatus Micrarchaeota archaeon]